MEPLKPEVRQWILDEHPQASPEDIDEYERLLAQRFTVDPDLPMAPDDSNKLENEEKRLAELYDKLFSTP
jgi:hypothetical protein